MGPGPEATADPCALRKLPLIASFNRAVRDSTLEWKRKCLELQVASIALAWLLTMH